MKKTVLIIMAIFLLTGCSKAVDSGKPLVYTSFYAIYDFASEIAGDKAEVYNMVPTGTEPHEWEPTVRDMARLSEADVLFYNGLGMESWIDSVKSALEASSVEFVELSESIQEENDPHIWLDPKNAKIMCREITDVLCSVDSANSKYYEENYSRYAAELDALDDSYKSAVNAVPENKRKIVVSHEAYGCMCSAYGLEQAAVEGMSAESEPSPAKVEEIIDYINSNNIKYIFYEELVSPKVAQTIADETGCQLLPLDPFEGVSKEGVQYNYISVMNKNLENIKIALGDE